MVETKAASVSVPLIQLLEWLSMLISSNALWRSLPLTSLCVPVRPCMWLLPQTTKERGKKAPSRGSNAEMPRRLLCVV